MWTKKERVMVHRKYLVFLDVDGVFTSSRVHMAHNASYDMWHRFDPVAVDFMNTIHDAHPVEFVIMSTWKTNLSLNSMMTEHWVRAAFGNSGFRGNLANPWKTNPDNLPRLANDRGGEVRDYLETFGTDVEDFVLFDDDAFNFHEALGKRRLVLTDSHNGLLHKHMLNALSLMGNWEKK